MVQSLNSNYAICIKEVQNDKLDSSTETNLAFNISDFEFMPTEMTKLETQHVPLSEASFKVKKIEIELEKITRQNEILIRQIFKSRYLFYKK